ncbi:hypothetical protein JCGZ_05483 [Jatropha curcas]|uniref:Uncharacterized protein n=1 Tax=Jatropha curcas TaxID=180498 RepID=A0A067L6B1_JATCU|nr:hypothetical protein JCGZ_05483 [Jatropha curcas]
MDSLLSSKRTTTFKSLNDGASPINTRLNADSVLMRYLRGAPPMTSLSGNGIGDDGFFSPTVSARSSLGSCSNSRNFGRSLSPLSSMENVMSPPVFGTPIKVVDEDVLVMDGILVESTSGGRVSRTLSSYSSGSPSNFSSSAGIRAYNMELCRSSEDFGHCRFGSNFQFAQSKEELRPTCFPMKNKNQTHSFKSNCPGSLPYGQRSRFLRAPVMTEVAVAASQTASASRPEYKNRRPVITVNSEYLGTNTSSIAMPLHLCRLPAVTKSELSSKSHIANIKSQDWSPLDDGIKIALPADIDKCSTASKDVDAYMHSVLHGPRTRKRLPVFAEFRQE